MSVNDYRGEPTSDLLEVKPGATAQSATFIFGNEDHTLGNTLRHILMQRTETDFCGYSVPHPYEPKMNIRLQTYENSATSVEVLKEGLRDMEKAADIIDDKFSTALAKYKR